MRLLSFPNTDVNTANPEMEVEEQRETLHKVNRAFPERLWWALHSELEYSAPQKRREVEGHRK